MLSNTDVSRLAKPLRLSVFFAAATLAAGCILATGCANLGDRSSPQHAAPALNANANVQLPAAFVAAPPAPIQIAAPLPEDPVLAVLLFADRIRPLQGAELIQEISRMNDTPVPASQLRQAIALAQTRQLYDLVRAQDLLQKVLINVTPEARPLHPLARLLATRYAEQRRVEDLLDRQGQQTKDAQRRLDQTNDKLEALKEIERSLTSRPAAAIPVPRNRARSATP